MIASRHAHVAGVAGVGMSAIAGALLDAGWRVTGSDRAHDQGQPLDTLETLRRAGVELLPQDGRAVGLETAALVVSTAIEDGNPELESARRAGVEVVHRAEMLARLAHGHEVVAVTGTAGKTTITGLLGWLLEAVGGDPAVVNGGVVLDWRRPDRLGNVRKGSAPFVLEADESDRSLLRFNPSRAIISNVSKDHFEFDEVVALFRAFAGQVDTPPVCGAGVAKLLGIQGVDVDVEPRVESGRWTFSWAGEHFAVPLPGRHNALNAALAVAMAVELGAAPSALARALPSFRGLHRRLERVGEAGGVTVLDDYAHNPAKIAASWLAVSETAPRVLGFWRPHGFGPLALMQDELADAFARVCRPQDRLWLLPVYYAGGTASRTVDSASFAGLLAQRGVSVQLAEDHESLRAALLREARSGDTILGMGARDPELPLTAARLVAELGRGAV